MAQEPMVEKANEFIADALENAKETLNPKITTAAARLADSAGTAWKAMRNQMRDNPGATLSIGAFLGFAIGFLVRGRD